MEQNLGWCDKEKRAHKFGDFRMKIVKKYGKWPQLVCVYCEELMRNHG